MCDGNYFGLINHDCLLEIVRGFSLKQIFTLRCVCRKWHLSLNDSVTCLCLKDESMLSALAQFSRLAEIDVRVPAGREPFILGPLAKLPSLESLILRSQDLNETTNLVARFCPTLKRFNIMLDFATGDYLDGAALRKLSAGCPQLHTLTLSDEVVVDELTCFTRGFEGITKLELLSEFPDSVFVSVVKGMPLLEALYVYNWMPGSLHLQRLRDRLPHLHDLIILDLLSEDDDDEGSLEELEGWPALKSLLFCCPELRSVERIAESGLQLTSLDAGWVGLPRENMNIVWNLPLLQKISVVVSGWGEESFLLLATGCPLLEEVSLDSSRSYISPAMVSALTHTLSRLRHLSLSGCHFGHTCDEALSVLVDKCPLLEHLSVPRYKLTDVTLPLIAKAARLRTLYLKESNSSACQNLHRFESKSLTHLSLVDSHSLLSAESIEAIIRACPLLKHLDLHGCEIEGELQVVRKGVDVVITPVKAFRAM